VTAESDDLDEQIRLRRDELGCELWAHISVSERRHEILIAPINQHPDIERLIAAPMPAGRTPRTFVHEREGWSPLEEEETGC